MPETTDPHAALRSKKLSERAAGSRDLGQTGVPDDIALLVDLARRDRSPGVRLNAAMAAADILSRYRFGSRRRKLKNKQRNELLQLFNGIDPGINPGLFSMLACIGVPDAINRLTVGLRDPRMDIRRGAVVGMRRLCSSQAVLGDKKLEGRVVGFLADARHPPDVLADLALLCASVGFDSARPHMEALDLPGAHGEMVEEGLARFDLLQQELPLVWVSDGRDAGEVGRDAVLPDSSMVLGEVCIEENDGRLVPLSFDAASGRRLYLRRPGESAPGPVLQAGGRTWYVGKDDALLGLVDRWTRPDELPWANLKSVEVDGALAQVLDLLLPMLGPKGPGRRAAALLLARGGRTREARAMLKAAVDAPRTPLDTWFFLGEALVGVRKKADARPHFERYLKKARKKDPYVARAQARLS